MSNGKTGRIVWHDLFTGDRRGSMAFYERVAGWTYQIEHASDFAWGGGEKDFILALLGEEAGAGFARTPPQLDNGWIAYVEVTDVDATAAHAQQLGGTVVRRPFEVPGVGRNALVRDPFGGLVGISLSRHSFPAPRRHFGVEVYLLDTGMFAEAFYKSLFGWTAGLPRSGTEGGNSIAGPSGDIVAFQLIGKSPNGDEAMWLPSLKVPDPKAAIHAAEALRAKQCGPVSPGPAGPQHVVLRDPQGASFCMRNV